MGIDRDRFVGARRSRWAELESLIQRTRGAGLGRAGTEEVMRLGKLYRLAAADLAVAKRYFPNDRLTTYLNALVRRAHPLVYQSAGSRRELWEYLVFRFPLAYRSAGRYIAVAFAIFAGAAVIAAVAVIFNGQNADLLLGRPEAASLRSVMSHHHLWVKSATSNHSVAANFIMLNNIQVAFLAFAGGALLGVGSVYILATNGLMFGAIAVLVADYGLSRPFWSFVVPHGVVELSVIFMAGGAGLMIGDAILRPGLNTRKQSLVRAARVSALLVLGAIPLLMVAGSIEGFFSASNGPLALHLAVGLVTGGLMYLYLLRPLGDRVTASASPLSPSTG